MIYVSAVLIPGFYFDKWRALATGIAVCGSGIGTFVLVPLNEHLVYNYGWRSAILVQAGKLRVEKKKLYVFRYRRFSYSAFEFVLYDAREEKMTRAS